MNKKKIAIIAAVSAVSFLILCYVGISIYFYQVFYPNTFVNGTDVSTMTPTEVKKNLKNTSGAYELEIQTIDGGTEVISGQSIGFEYNFDEVDRVKKNEMGWAWPVKFFTRTEYSIDAECKWDEAELEAEVNRLKCMTQEMIPPVNASLTIDEGGVHLEEAVKGNTLKKDKILEVISDTLSSGKREINLEAQDCYEMPQITSESPEIQDQLKRVDELCQAEVTYNFHGNEEKIGKDQIRNWVRQDGDGNLYVDRDSAYNYLCELAGRYDTVGAYRNFWSSRGYEITLNPGTYGWGTDVDTEVGLLMDDILNKRVTSREPVYYMTPYHGLDPNTGNDIGSTYVEIDLSGQYMWYYLNGSVFVSTPITSGTMNTGHATPSGVYFINCRTQNTILVGEDYKTPVNFWMQVVGGVGIHDSLWRSVYGGSEYINDGSHGCINTPYDAVSSIFWNIEVGVPVIMYY